MDEESWWEELLKSGNADKISAQKSSITNKDSGEVYEFQNRKFVDWIRDPANKEAHLYCKNKIKESLVIEQDPFSREEESVVEELQGEEEL